MKLRHLFIISVTAILLAACNMTLAADVTPPPNYVPPTPVPTLGALYPASAPDIENGAVIYAEKCAPCHGDTGFGDGEQGKQLPVTVAAFALPETASKASPVKWYTIVTQGNIDRFMPPFLSLSEQERWDVVGYALTLHVTEKDLQRGKELYETFCGNCPTEIFRNQEWMASLSNMELAQLLQDGTPNFPALESKMTEGGFTELAAYVRTLTFAPPAALAAVSVTETPVPAEATPSAEETPEAGGQAEVTPEAADAGATSEEPGAASAGRIRGVIDNQTGADLPSELKVTLRGFDHGTDPSAGPQEFINIEVTVSPDGTYVFEIGEIVERQIYIAELELNGLKYQSEFGVVPAGTTELTLPSIVVYATTEDYSELKIESLQIFFDLAGENTAQIFAVYTISNISDKTILVKIGDGQTVPFIAFPEGASGLGYEATQDSAAFVPTADGFAMPPSDVSYGLIAFASIPKEKEITISQPALLSISKLTLFLPEGVEAKGSTLTDTGIQPIQNTNFHVYDGSAVEKGGSIEFTLSGKPTQTAVAPNITQNQTLLIGIGALGVALILAGVWMYRRDSKKEEEFEEEQEQEFDDAESIMDAIIALDELHRAGKLPDQAYKQRRTDLKDALKRNS
ncbi:MAG: cytochrome c [Anaerolineales bacterium]|nr:MAG: cytochrome c [Anaerolineales bacterium]